MAEYGSFRPVSVRGTGLLTVRKENGIHPTKKPSVFQGPKGKKQLQFNVRLSNIPFSFFVAFSAVKEPMGDA